MIPNKLGIKSKLITAIFIRIETTLRYDHVSDDMVREYFEKQLEKPKNINTEVENGEKQDRGFCYV